jgi:hypothetical protein
METRLTNKFVQQNLHFNPYLTQTVQNPFLHPNLQTSHSNDLQISTAAVSNEESPKTSCNILRSEEQKSTPKKKRIRQKKIWQEEDDNELVACVKKFKNDWKKILKRCGRG